MLTSSLHLPSVVSELGLSRLGLGAAGPSRLGVSHGAGLAELDRLLGCAASLGINWVDTAGAIGGLDGLLGSALSARSEDFRIATKIHVGPGLGPMAKSRLGNRLSARLSADTSLVAGNRTLIARVDDLLRTFCRERIDVLWLHAVHPTQFARLEGRLEELGERLKSAGKVAAFGITETFKHDPGHDMLRRAAASGLFDLAMAAFNPSIPGLRELIDRQKKTQPAWVTMIALRGVLVRSRELLDRSALPLGEYGLDGVEAEELLIRYAIYRADGDFLLLGTGNPEHLEKNVVAAAKGPLSEELCATLERLLAA